MGFFYPNITIPKFLAHIQDRDIFTHTIAQTREFVAYFYEQEFNGFTFEVLNFNT